MNTQFKAIAAALLVLLAFSSVSCVSVHESRPEPQAQEPPPQLVTVNFDSRPPAAEVYVDGLFIGTTRLTVQLPAGEHEVELRKVGYEVWTRTLNVLPSNHAGGTIQNVAPELRELDESR